jgi:nitroreductase
MSVIETIHQHRSIRKYKSDPIPEDLLARILEAGIRASSSGNMQTYSIIVTQESVLREQLYKAHFEQKVAAHQPCPR